MSETLYDSLGKFSWYDWRWYDVHLVPDVAFGIVKCNSDIMRPSSFFSLGTRLAEVCCMRPHELSKMSCLSIYIYIYIYGERQKERERQREVNKSSIRPPVLKSINLGTWSYGC